MSTGQEALILILCYTLFVLGSVSLLKPSQTEKFSGKSTLTVYQTIDDFMPPFLSRFKTFLKGTIVMFISFA